MEDEVQPEVAAVHHEMGRIKGSEDNLIYNLYTFRGVAPQIVSVRRLSPGDRRILLLHNRWLVQPCAEVVIMKLPPEKKGESIALSPSH